MQQVSTPDIKNSDMFGFCLKLMILSEKRLLTFQQLDLLVKPPRERFEIAFGNMVLQGVITDNSY